jgi:DNA polymerase III sliding clamp (beta) subunit (PCNA family)
MISFAGGGKRLTARLIAGDFIRYRSRFPAEFGCRAELPAGQFIDAVRRVCIVAERASPVRLAFGADEVVIEARDEGRARAVESVAAEFTGDEPVISFNPQYLLDGLIAAAALASGRQVGAGSTARPDPSASERESSAGQQGRIRLDFTSPAKPALITWVEDQVSDSSAANGKAETGDAARDETPAFRYLVVPLRVPVRA